MSATSEPTVKARLLLMARGAAAGAAIVAVMVVLCLVGSR